MRAILIVIGLFFLIMGMSLLWGYWSDWYTSFLLGSTFIAFSIAILWTATLQSYKALVGGGFGLMVTFGGSAIFALRLGKIWYGEVFLYLALISLWFFFYGLKHFSKKGDRLPYSVRWLFGIVLTLALIEGIYMVIPLPTHFIWLLNPVDAVFFGWLLLGGSIFFGWILLQPTWENGYPALYSLLAYDLLLIGPVFRLFREPTPVVTFTFYLWAAILVIIGTGIWTVVELCIRFFRRKI